MYYYLIFGLGLYIGAAITNSASYKDQNLASIIRGILGCIFWPVTLIILLMPENKK